MDYHQRAIGVCRLHHLADQHQATVVRGHQRRQRRRLQVLTQAFLKARLKSQSVQGLQRLTHTEWFGVAFLVIASELMFELVEF